MKLTVVNIDEPWSFARGREDNDRQPAWRSCLRIDSQGLFIPPAAFKKMLADAAKLAGDVQQ